jgi:predicted AAA+ superfamily ATPase
MEVEALARQNPWWTEKEGIEKDEDVRKWEEGKIKWIPSLLEEISLKPFSLNFVFGPRQVGKTTLLKLLIRNLLAKGIEGERIFYFKCDKLANYKELDEVLKTYFEFRKAKGISSSFILLDEITFPTEWFRTIKYYVDVGEFKKDVLILTGSLSMHLKKEVELFPGRRGFGKDFIMLPLSFREFIKVFSPKLYKKLPKIEKIEKNEIFKKLFVAMPFFDEIEKLFEKYIAIGGFPLAVKNESITEMVKESYWSWIKTDIAKIGRNEETLKRVAKAIVEKAPSAISLNSIAKEFEIGTHKTAFEYLDIMEKLYIVKILYYLDLQKLIASFKKNRKVCFMDPFFFHLFADICLSKLPEESIILENIVASHLARKYEVFYWKNKQEIDIIVKDKELNGFEVKWKEKVSDYSKLKVGKLKNVFCLTKEEISKEKNVLPASLFLSLI